MAISTARPKGTLVEPKTPHLADPALAAFLQQDFDPATYLNNTLPTLSVSATTSRSSYANAASLPELSSQIQTSLSQLNAHTSRLSNILTQLTDEIVRSGGRLAYEVEILRGEAIGLTDALGHSLKEDIAIFVPAPDGTDRRRKSNANGTAHGALDKDISSPRHQHLEKEVEELEQLTRLRTLTTVRDRLDSVIKIFDQAMKWPVAPSEITSGTSSLISVAAPETTEENRVLEGKGKEFAEATRRELSELIGSGDDTESLEAAAAKIEGLRTLAEVWKGTAEEKARVKFIDSLHKFLEDRMRSLGKTAKDSTSASTKITDYRYGNLDSKAITDGGYGFLQNLRSLKPEVYLD